MLSQYYGFVSCNRCGKHPGIGLAKRVPIPVVGVRWDGLGDFDGRYGTEQDLIVIDFSERVRNSLLGNPIVERLNQDSD